jgi:hypothetical protein
MISVTPTRTPTPTPSITPSTSPSTVNIILNARVDPSASPSTNLLIFQSSKDGGATWVDIGATFDDTVCQQRAVETVIQGSSLRLRIKDTITNGVFSTNFSINATCPGYTSGADACDWLVPTNANRTIAFNINIDNQLVC